MVRDEVLHALEAHRGQFISGGALARELGVSRTAVWKAISGLRDMGFPIESVSGEGYRLSENSDALSQAGVSLSLQTEYLGRNLHICSEIDSTNHYLKQNAASLPDGFAVISDRQTAGRGRLGRSFFSPSGSGIYLSVLLRPNLPLTQINLFTIGAAVALCQAIEETADFTPDIKWVNDVLMHGKKLCGILTEAAIEAETGSVSYVVVGIGINIRRPQGDVPEELRDIMGFIEDYAPHSVRRNAFAASLLNHMEHCFELICSGNTAALMDAYRSFIRFLGEPITVIQNGVRTPATAVAIDPEGHLIIMQNGVESTLYAGEISIRLPDQAQ